MALILLSLYCLFNIWLLCYYFNKEFGVFQYPFLIGCVSLAFVMPQLIGIYLNRLTALETTILPLFVFLTCNIGLFWGYKIGTSMKITKVLIVDNSKLEMPILLFVIVGLCAFILNRGVYQGGFVSGVFVIVNFFTNYLTYGLILLLIYLKTDMAEPDDWKRKIAWIFVGLIVLANIDKFISLARRGSAISFALIIFFLIFSFYPHLYKKLRIIIPVLFFIGMFSNSQIGQFRENSYSGEVSVSDNFNQLKIGTLSSVIIGSSEGEVNNAFIGINNAHLYNIQDYGAFNWNSLVNNFLPKAIIGEKTKNELMIETTDEGLTAWLTRSGSTMTGYYDSYKSFGVFAFLKFMLIGLIMGYVWNKAQVSDFYYAAYFGFLTPGLLLLTHSSGNFFASIVFYGVFVFPFLKPSIYKETVDYV